jgi:redox-sensitive bicupin YhaK (pirin superfamily)
MLGCQLWVNLPAKNKMTEPAYRDITPRDVEIVSEVNAEVRIVSGRYKGKHGAVKNEYIKVQYLDVDLKPGSIWQYNETPDDQTLFLYLIEGSLAADENLDHFEEKACAILLTASSEKENESDEVVVRSGDKGARFLLIAGKPLREPVAWGGPIVMNTDEELDLAFSELNNHTFIKHERPQNF